MRRLDSARGNFFAAAMALEPIPQIAASRRTKRNSRVPRNQRLSASRVLSSFPLEIAHRRTRSAGYCCQTTLVILRLWWAVVGRIFNAAASPVGTPCLWTLAYDPTREAAMAAFAKSWRRE
jgi:hypothetical protein